MVVSRVGASGTMPQPMDLVEGHVGAVENDFSHGGRRSKWKEGQGCWWTLGVIDPLDTFSCERLAPRPVIRTNVPSLLPFAHPSAIPCS